MSVTAIPLSLKLLLLYIVNENIIKLNEELIELQKERIKFLEEKLTEEEIKI